jgi:hypothetical protein
MHFGAEVLDRSLIVIEDGVLEIPQALTLLPALLLVEMHVLAASAGAFDRLGKAQTHNGFLSSMMKAKQWNNVRI